jgi:hypothetical protein
MSNKRRCEAVNLPQSSNSENASVRARRKKLARADARSAAGEAFLSAGHLWRTASGNLNCGQG